MARKEDSRVTRLATSQLNTIEEKFPRSAKGILWYLTLRFLFQGVGIRNGHSESRLSRWDALLKRFVMDPNNGIPQTAEGRTSARGNLTNQVFSEDEGMSMATFVKAAAVCETAELDIIAIWKMKDGQRIVGKVSYPLTPDTLVSMREEDEVTALMQEFNEFLTSENVNPALGLEIVNKVEQFKAKKKLESSND